MQYFQIGVERSEFPKQWSGMFVYTHKNCFECSDYTYEMEILSHFLVHFCGWIGQGIIDKSAKID